MSDFGWNVFLTNGWTITVGGGLAVLLLAGIASAIWKPVRLAIAQAVSWTVGLRIKTATGREELREEGRDEIRAFHVSPPILAPVNWFVVEVKSERGLFDLVNSSPEAEAFDVIVSDGTHDAQVVGNTHWDKIAGATAVRFGVHLGPDARLFGTEFQVSWRDGNGVAHERWLTAKMPTTL